MSTVELNGTTVYVSAIESVEYGVSHEYDRLWNRAVGAYMALPLGVSGSEEEIVFPKAEDYPAVIVKLTSGREFRIVGKTREEVELGILLSKRRDRS